MRRRWPYSVALVAVILSTYCQARESAPHWVRVNSGHFVLISDGDPEKVREAAVRLEQMRLAFGDLLNRTAVRISQPVDVIAVRADEEYARLAPARANGAGTMFQGKDRTYILLNLAQSESWRAIERPLAIFLLNYNYPPTQPWFDNGFADYFSTYRPGDKSSSIGEDPRAGAYTSILTEKAWLPLQAVFADTTNTADAGVFEAESWMAFHYLVRQNKLSEVGAYFGLVKVQHAPFAEAIQQAFGMPPDALQGTIHKHFADFAQHSGAFAGPVIGDSGNIGTGVQELATSEAQALEDEFDLRVPDRRDAALRDLKQLDVDVKTDSAIVHRALGWDATAHNQYEKGQEEYSAAMKLDPRDAWTRYYLSVNKFEAAKARGEETAGLANMLQDLKFVLEWNPQFAEADNLLGLARLQGGGANSAMQSFHAAIELAPRNQQYLLNMSDAYLAAKKWDAATDMLDRLKSSPDAAVAKGAQERLTGLPDLKKYGRALGAAAPASASTPKPVESGATSSSGDDEPEVSEGERPVAPPVDKRQIKYAKGRLLNVDCSNPPAATLAVSVEGKKLLLRAADTRTLVTIGAEKFSCDWENKAASVNYKPGGQLDGDVVSIEVR